MYNLENNIELTDKIKNAFKKGITRAYLKYDDIEINPENYLMSVDFSDEKADPEDGRFIGKAICRSIDIKLNNKSSALNLENKELEYYLGAKVDGNFVYINFGKFIVQKPENQEVNEETTFTAGWSINTYNVKFIANQFNPVSTQTVDGITASFDNTTSYLTLNGTNTSTRVSLHLIDCEAFTVGDKYELVDQT